MLDADARVPRQAVLICGESGSGKTETTKFVLNYLVRARGAAAGRGDLTQMLMDSNPVMEARRADQTASWSVRRARLTQQLSPGSHPIAAV